MSELAKAIASMRAQCNFVIREINAGTGVKTPGFSRINNLLRAADAVFSAWDMGSPTPPEAPEAVSVDGEGDDLRTHRRAWRKAITDCIEYCENNEDPVDAGYWQHELRAFDRAFAALSTPVNIPADGEVERVALAMIASIEDRDFYDPSPDEWRIAARAAIAALCTKADAGDGR